MEFRDRLIYDERKNLQDAKINIKKEKVDM